MLGVGVATAMIAVATDIGDKISRELRTYGANLIVTPQEDTLDVEIGGVNLKPPSDGAYLNEADLPKIKGMFWRNNIVGFAPMLPVNVNSAGQNLTLLGTYFSQSNLRSANRTSPPAFAPRIPGGEVQGAWPEDNSTDVLLGEHLAAKLNRTAGQRQLKSLASRAGSPAFSPPAERKTIRSSLHLPWRSRFSASLARCAASMSAR